MRTFEVQNLRNMQKLMLLDAYALIFRAYYGLIRSPRINSKGENTSAVFGFVNTLEELLRTEQPDFLAVAFDPPGGTFRHEAFADYKAQREETPAGIKWAVPVIKDILEAYGIVACEVKGFEADDVIGTRRADGHPRQRLRPTRAPRHHDVPTLVRKKRIGETGCRSRLRKIRTRPPYSSHRYARPHG